MPNFLWLIELYFLREDHVVWQVLVFFDKFAMLFPIGSSHTEDVWDNYENCCTH